jgi:hypothetical protein
VKLQELVTKQPVLEQAPILACFREPLENHLDIAMLVVEKLLAEVYCFGYGAKYEQIHGKPDSNQPR